MIIECDSCRTKFRLDDSRITPGGVRVRCTKCQNVFIVKPPPSPDEVSVEELFGVSSESVRGSEATESPGGGGPSAEEGFEEGVEGADEPWGSSDAGDAGEAEERAPAAAAGFEGLDFSFTMDRSDEEGEEGEAEEGEAEDESPAGGAYSEDSSDDDEDAGYDAGPGAVGPDEGDETGDEAVSVTQSSMEDSEGDEPRGFDLGIDSDEGTSTEGAPDVAESTYESDAAAGDWDISAGTGEDEPSDDEEAGPVAGDDDEAALAGEMDSGGPSPEDTESALPEDDDWGADEEADLTAGFVGDALAGLEDEEPSNGRVQEHDWPEDEEELQAGGAEEQLRELEKKVIPFTMGVPREAPAAGAAEEPDDDEAGDLDWPRAPRAGGFDDDTEDAGEFGASAVAAAADYSTAATGQTETLAGAGPAAASRAKVWILVVLFAIIILGGGGLYLSGAFDSTGGGGASAPAGAVVDIELMKGYVVENKAFGNYFAVEAMVRNKTDEPQEIKGARGVLFNSSGTRIAERITTPGRVLSAEDLRTMTAAELERYFKDPTGGTIPAKGVIPVMVLFTDMPVGISEYGVDVIR